MLSPVRPMLVKSRPMFRTAGATGCTRTCGRLARRHLTSGGRRRVAAPPSTVAEGLRRNVASREDVEEELQLVGLEFPHLKTTVFAAVGIGGHRKVNDRQRPSSRGRNPGDEAGPTTSLLDGR